MIEDADAANELAWALWHRATSATDREALTFYGATIWSAQSQTWWGGVFVGSRGPRVMIISVSPDGHVTCERDTI